MWNFNAFNDFRFSLRCGKCSFCPVDTGWRHGPWWPAPRIQQRRRATSTHRKLPATHSQATVGLFLWRTMLLRREIRGNGPFSICLGAGSCGWHFPLSLWAPPLLSCPSFLSQSLPACQETKGGFSPIPQSFQPGKVLQKPHVLSQNHILRWPTRELFWETCRLWDSEMIPPLLSSLLVRVRQHFLSNKILSQTQDLVI